MHGPGAFIVLKALAFDQRSENKDAYDLYFMIRNYGSGVDDVSRCLSPLLKEVETKKALEILNRDFSEPDGVGPSRVSPGSSIEGRMLTSRRMSPVLPRNY